MKINNHYYYFTHNRRPYGKYTYTILRYYLKVSFLVQPGVNSRFNLKTREYCCSLNTFSFITFNVHRKLKILNFCVYFLPVILNNIYCQKNCQFLLLNSK